MPTKGVFSIPRKEQAAAKTKIRFKLEWANQAKKNKTNISKATAISDHLILLLSMSAYSY